MSKLSVDRVLLHRFVVLVRVLFAKTDHYRCSITLLLSVIVFLTSVAEQIATYYVGILPSEFFVALGDRNLASFQYLVGKSAVIILAKAAILAASKYFTSMFSLKCREVCAKTLHKYYFIDFVYYRINTNTKVLDNPDQRMTQDVEKLTRILTVDLYAPVVTAPFIIAYYTYLTYNSSGWFGPFAIYLYFIASTLVNKLLLSPIVTLVNEQEKREGDLRARHLEVRSNVEAIAFYRSGKAENIMADNKLNSLLKVQKKLIEWRTILCLATSIFDYYGGTLSYLIIAIPIFLTKDFDGLSGIDLSGIISKNVFFYLYLIYSFTRLVALAENFGDMAGVCHRVVELLEELKRLKKEAHSKLDEDNWDLKNIEIIKKDNNAERVSLGEIHEPVDDDENAVLLNENSMLAENTTKAVDNDVVFSFKDASIASPNNPDNTLIKNLTMDIVRGENLLISGDSSTGKTSLLRAIAGLWNCISGISERHWDVGLDRMLFLPQNPYFPSGGTTLRQQLTYPAKASEDKKETDRLMDIVRSLKMENAVQRFSGLDEKVDGDWNEMLSRGELQRLAIGRVLNHLPKIAFLDECTSAVGADMQTAIYELIKKEGITAVSVGHRLSLRHFHEMELHLDGNGGWSLRKIENHKS